MEKIKQTGLLYEYNPRDYRVGASPLSWVEINPTGDWREWKPDEEKQYKYFTFDTLSCATFSALNVMENFVNFLMYKDYVTLDKLEWLNKNGYIVNGKLNLSDRFTAIMSGTTNLGNYMPKVWDSIRKDGCIPEADFPFDGNTFEEYHNKSLITEKMKNKAKQFNEIFECFYEWGLNTDPYLTNILKQCPAHIAVYQGHHAVELIERNYMFDTYEPHLRPLDSDVTYVLKIQVKVKSQRTLRKGMFGSDVQKLQEDLKYLGYLVINNTTQNFGSMTETAVVKLQRENGLTADGIVGQKTFAKIKELKEKPKIIQKKTPNFTVGRKTYKPEAIVIHVMDGTLIGTDSWFENPFSSVSSHYGIGKSGEIHQYVKEEDQAWHAGKVISPQWSLLKPGVNPNLYTVGIEHEGTASTAWPEAMKKASARLIKEISLRWNIPLDREHVIGHYQINGEKPNCPAVNKSVIDELINLAKVI